MVLSIVHLMIITAVAFIPWALFPENDYRFKFLTGIIIVVILFKPIYKLIDTFLNLFLKRSSAMLQKKLYALTYNLSETQHLQIIHHEMCNWLFHTFTNSRCAMVFDGNSNTVFKGWSTQNTKVQSGFFKTPYKIPAGDTPLTIDTANPIVKKMMSTRLRFITHGMVDRWINENRIPRDPADWLQHAGIIIPIFSQLRLISILLIGNKLNDRSYTKPEKEILQNLGVILGPFIENAKILEGLERQVEKRTEDLYAAFEDIKRKNDKISKNHAVIKKQNHIFLSLFETSTHIHEIDELLDLYEFT